MKKNTYSISCIVYISLLLILGLLFLKLSEIYLWSTTFTLISYSLFSVLLAVVFVMHTKHHVGRLLGDVSLAIENIINLQDKHQHSGVDDTLLSKIQVQLLKLVSILKRQESTIKKERDEIKSLISDIVHQLKTPLANLQLYEELLQEEDLDQEERTLYLSNIHDQIHRLTFLFDAMTKITRLESGIIELIPEETSSEAICLTALKQVYPVAKHKNIHVKVNLGANCPLLLHKKWTTEAVFNILENAIKYSPSSSHLNISTETYNLFLRIDIQDEGCGVKEEEIPHLFKRFYRGKRHSNTDGAGLGLYLSREIIQEQGGYIKVTPKEKGTLFSIFLPIPVDYYE